MPRLAYPEPFHGLRIASTVRFQRRMLYWRQPIVLARWKSTGLGQHEQSVAAVLAKPRLSPKRILIALLGAAAGFTLCLVILRKSDPLMAPQDVYFFSFVSGVVLAGIAWKIS